MRVFPLVLVASSALQSRTDGTVTAANIGTTELYGSAVVPSTGDGQDDIMPDKLLLSNDTGIEEDRLNLLNPEQLLERAKQEVSHAERTSLIEHIAMLGSGHPGPAVHPPLDRRPALKNLLGALTDDKMLLDTLSTAHTDVLESASIALLMRSEASFAKAAGWELTTGLFAKWKSEGLTVDQIFDRVLIDKELVTKSDVAGKVGSLSDEILRVYCRMKQNGDYTYIGAMIRKFGGKTGLGEQLYAALQSSPDRARAVKLIDTWLGLLVSRGKAPHRALEIALQLKTSLLDGQLFEDELLPLLYKYVVLYNEFKLTDERKTLAKELSLLYGATTVDERLATRVQNWLQLEPQKKTRTYVLEQVFQDWKVHGEPGGKVGQKWPNLNDRYAEHLQRTRPKG